MDVSVRILRDWMPAIHAGMTELLMVKMPLNIGLGVEGACSFFMLCKRAPDHESLRTQKQGG